MGLAWRRETEEGMYSWFSVANRYLQRRWVLTLLGGTLRKGKKQRSQVATRET